MARDVSGPWISQTDREVGFRWMTAAGERTTLVQVLTERGSEADRLLPTHLEALDDVLIGAAERFGDVLGGGRSPADHAEELALIELSVTLDRTCVEYAGALAATSFPADLRAGQIVGTASLMSILARSCVGRSGPVPLAGQLDDPSMGVIAGFGEMVVVDSVQPWRGGRWVVRTEAGKRFPAMLSMLLFDSSGVNKEAALDEHRAALVGVVAAAQSADADPDVAAGAIDWLLYDWLLAHRDGPDSGAIEIKSGRLADATMIVSATAASATLRRPDSPKSDSR